MLEELHKKFEISPVRFEGLKNQIVTDYAAEISSQKQPVAYILGGQPGAGKTELERIAIAETKGDVVSCNADNFRDYHPSSQAIRQDYEIYYPELTVGYAHRWNNALKAYCEQNRMNLILETTFSSGEKMNTTIAELKEKGYQVKLKILAVHPLLSLLATYVRFENNKKTEGSGRMVGKQIHDERFYKLFPTLTCVQRDKLYDELNIYIRDETVNVLSSHHRLKLIADNPRDPRKIYFDYITKHWSRELLNQFTAQILDIEDMMNDRKASSFEKETFKSAMRAEYDLSILQRQMIINR